MSPAGGNWDDKQKEGDVSRRTVYKIPGVGHRAPIPLAARVGNVLWSSALLGATPGTGALPESAEAQVAQLFDNVRQILRQAGMGPEDVVHVSVLLGDDAHRTIINEEWTRMFPDEDDRPARHVTLTTPAAGAVAQLEFVAVAT